MRIYVVVSISQDEISSVFGFFDPGEAEAEIMRLEREEAETDAQLYEIDIDARPASVIIRRQIW